MQLNSTTSNFKSVLEVRRDALQASQARRNLFASGVPGAGEFTPFRTFDCVLSISCSEAAVVCVLLCVFCMTARLKHTDFGFGLTAWMGRALSNNGPVVEQTRALTLICDVQVTFNSILFLRTHHLKVQRGAFFSLLSCCQP
jgi:hypothetical protein